MSILSSKNNLNGEFGPKIFLNLFLIYFTAPPIFLVEPTDQKVAEGAPASLDCIASGNPTPTLFWIKESSPGIILPATTNGLMTVTPEGTLRIGKRLKISEIVQT